MREIPGVDPEALERLYLVASAKAQIMAAEQLLREAISNLKIVEAAGTGDACVAAARAIVALREKVFQVLEDLP